MESGGSVPEMTFESGVEVEERSFIWKVKNFTDDLKDMKQMYRSGIDFFAGDSLSCSSKYGICLLHRYEHIPGQPSPYFGPSQSKGMGFGLMSKQPPAWQYQNVYAQCSFSLKDEEGAVYFRTETQMTSLSFLGSGAVVEGKDCLEPDWELPLDKEGSLVVHVTFKVKLNSPLGSTLSVETVLDRFLLKSTAKARRELGDLLETPGASQNVRIVSNDGKGFTVPRGVLAARSQVFKAMLGADMVEGRTGVIHIQDMGSKSLKVLLNYLYTGELLHPDWRESKVLVELTNSVAKYQLLDLLRFLDGMLGKVCDLDNVGALVGLAQRLSMEMAEYELLSFIRRNGTISMESVMRMFKGVTNLEEAEVQTLTTIPDNVEEKSLDMDSGVDSSEISSSETLTISGDNYDDDNVNKSKVKRSPLWCLCWRPKLSPTNRC